MRNLLQAAKVVGMKYYPVDTKKESKLSYKLKTTVLQLPSGFQRNITTDAYYVPTLNSIHLSPHQPHEEVTSRTWIKHSTISEKRKRRGLSSIKSEILESCNSQHTIKPPKTKLKSYYENLLLPLSTPYKVTDLKKKKNINKHASCHIRYWTSACPLTSKEDLYFATHENTAAQVP